MCGVVVFFVDGEVVVIIYKFYHFISIFVLHIIIPIHTDKIGTQ